MDVLILSNMYPSEESFAGIFVKNQFKKIQSYFEGQDDDIEILFMRRRFTNLFGSIIKYSFFFLRSLQIFTKRYDVVHLHYFFPLGIIPFLYKKVYPNCKIVVTFHGSDVYSCTNSKLLGFFYKKFAKDVDELIVVGNELGAEVKQRLGIEPNHILSAGVDQNVFYSETQLKKLYDFLFVGAFNKQKGIDLLCRAIKKKNDTDISYCFVGSGPLDTQISELEDLGYNITIKRNRTQEQLRKIYNQSKWLLFPSRKEAFGLVVTESIFCGTPVLTSKVGGIKEQVQDGNNGFFLDGISVDSIVSLMEKATSLNDKRYKQMQENCLSSNKQYSLDSVCQKMIEIYKA